MVDVYKLYTFTKEFQNLTQRNQYQLQFFYTEINDIEQCTGNTQREEGFRLHEADQMNQIITVAILYEKLLSDNYYN